MSESGALLWSKANKESACETIDTASSGVSAGREDDKALSPRFGDKLGADFFRVKPAERGGFSQNACTGDGDTLRVKRPRSGHSYFF